MNFVAFNLNMLVYIFFLSQLSPLLSLIHVQCGADNDKKQQSVYFHPFK